MVVSVREAQPKGQPLTLSNAVGALVQQTRASVLALVEEAPAGACLETLAEVWIHHFLEAEAKVLVPMVLKKEVSVGGQGVTCHGGVRMQAWKYLLCREE